MSLPVFFIGNEEGTAGGQLVEPGKGILAPREGGKPNQER